MRFSEVIAAAVTVGSAVAQVTACSGDAGLLVACVTSYVTATTCTNAACACSQVSSISSCYNSYCPTNPVPSTIFSAAFSQCASATAVDTATATGSAVTATSTKSAAGLRLVLPGSGLVSLMISVWSILY